MSFNDLHKFTKHTKIGGAEHSAKRPQVVHDRISWQDIMRLTQK